MNNWIIIAGNGRNTFKTSIACRIIEANREQKVYGVKVSPHFHPLDNSNVYITNHENLVITQENKINSKDSSRMLQSGAQKVFYVQCTDEHIEEAVQKLEELTRGHPVVCESGGLRKVVDPSLFVMMKSAAYPDKANYGIPDLIVDAGGPDPAAAGSLVRYENGKWKIS